MTDFPDIQRQGSGCGSAVGEPRIHGSDDALAVDLYQLTMCQSYLAHGMVKEAVFEVFVRRLPPERNYLVACGLDRALAYLETLSFTEEQVEYLASLFPLRPELRAWLRRFRFSGDVYAIAEGTPVFAGEPLLQVVAPLPEAQLVETALLNIISFQTLVASKAARIVTAAGARPVVDFGMRRMHGFDAAVEGARAAYLAGATSTSNVLAGRRYGIPVTGTMAHSYVQAWKDERAAFATIAADFPDTVLLVDTYDTRAGVANVVELARQLGCRLPVRGIRLDSGDLGTLAREARAVLDGAGLQGVEIVASGGLDEYRIADLVASGAPIDVFGVGTKMGVSADRPYLDTAYKLVAYGGEGRVKLSAGKATLPLRKQVFRRWRQGRMEGDTLTLAEGCGAPGEPLLELVLQGGARTPGGQKSLLQSRAGAAAGLAALPPELRELGPAQESYPVVTGAELEAAFRQVRGI